MITKIIPGSVFSTDKQRGEKNIIIACGTNTAGSNNPEGGSVAGKIAKNYTPEFEQLGQGKPGEYHIREFSLTNDETARAVGIVCNEQNPGTWCSDNQSDWSEAQASIVKGFNGILEEVTDGKEIIISRLDIKSIISDSEAEFRRWKKSFNPIIRSVLIGSGYSGKANDADVAAILRAMQESQANIHLYLQQLESQAQVAKVIPLFSDISTLEDVSGYENLLKEAA